MKAKLRPSAARFNAPDRIRTCDLRFRRPTLYPAELRAPGRAAAGPRLGWRILEPRLSGVSAPWDWPGLRGGGVYSGSGYGNGRALGGAVRDRVRVRLDRRLER